MSKIKIKEADGNKGMGVEKCQFKNLATYKHPWETLFVSL